MDKPEFGDPSTWNQTVSQYLEPSSEQLGAFPGLSGPKVMPELTPGMEPIMPTAPGMEDPRLRQIELADGGTVNYNRNPLGKNQYEIKSIEEIKNIIESNPDLTAKDLEGYGKKTTGRLLTRDDLQRAKKAGIVPGATGKHKLVSPREKDIRRLEKLKPVQGGVIMLEGSRKTPTGKPGHGKEFSHIFPFMEGVPQTTKMTGVISGTMNRKLQPFNVIGQEIADQQKQILLEDPNNKRKIMELNAKAKRNAEEAVATLGKEYKGNIGYYQVDPDTLDIRPKAGNWKNTFAGIKGKEESFLEMGGKGRANFQKEQSKKIMDQFLKGQLQLEMIPGLKSTGEFISSAAEDLMKRRYLTGALKTAGVAGLGYGIYDTGVGFMEGKSVPELATRFVGLDPLYQSAIQYAALSPEAKDIQKKINYEESYKASLEEPLDEGLMSLAPMQKATVREVEKLKQEKQEIEQKQAAIDAARAQERENILSALKAKITGQPVSMEFATGGRVGLEKGGDPKDKPILPMNPMMDEGVQDPSKRGFLKGAGALGLGSFLLGPGILKLAKTFKTKEALNLIQHTAPGQPEWFAPLVEKILTKGTMKKINDKVLDDLYTYHTYEEGGKTITLKKSKPSATDPNATKIDITVEGGGAYDEPFYIEYQYPLPKQYNITPDGDMIPVKTKESNSIFRVSESRPQWQRSGPDDYSLESTVEDFQAISPKEDIFSLPKGKTGILSDVEGLEKIATGKIKNPKLQEARQKVKDKVLETPNEDRVIRYNDYLDLDYYE